MLRVNKSNSNYLTARNVFFRETTADADADYIDTALFDSFTEHIDIGDNETLFVKAGPFHIEAEAADLPYKTVEIGTESGFPLPSMGKVKVPHDQAHWRQRFGFE